MEKSLLSELNEDRFSRLNTHSDSYRDSSLNPKRRILDTSSEQVGGHSNKPLTNFNYLFFATAMAFSERGRYNFLVSSSGQARF